MTTTIKNINDYIYPPRAKTCVPNDYTDIYAEENWIAQYKYNDTRIILKLKQDKFELWNRHGEQVKNYTPTQDLIEQLNNLNIPKNTILDGGLLDNKHTAIKDTIVIWDILILNGEHLLGTTHNHRQQILKQLLPSTTPYTYNGYNLGNQQALNILTTTDYKPEQWPEMWETINEINKPYVNPKTKELNPLIEGLVFKNPNGVLEPGYSENNNTTWLAKTRVKTKRARF